MKVLIVDDDDNARRLAKFHLERAEHSVHCVDNGQAAVEAYQAEPPDAVLMNVMMPVVDGCEATRQILAQDPDARIIMDSGSSSCLRTAIQDGALACFLKPYDLPAVIEVLALVAKRPGQPRPYKVPGLAKVGGQALLTLYAGGKAKMLFDPDLRLEGEVGALEREILRRFQGEK